MKAFLRNDYYIQLSIFFVAVFIALAGLLAQEGKLFFVFYFGVGFSQLISYCIRIFCEYRKSIIFKIYGFLIMPVFLSLLGLYLFGNQNGIASFCLFAPVLSIFYSPVMAILYLIDIYKTYQSFIAIKNVNNIS
ncbi:hypothetical protein SAMN05880574_1286 [Chryseobacterium sp. RU37D]|uniref:hypothetical protein n=1 Tax=Chryseobacterium sp. RU37D TaxID=1907397 RepID=UPI000955DDF2|nr:hypothetical protein [Chryseobacterium sp. RU37D]SIQ83740.1 hypothetical protein SAMN05880574_1286 [Chryseobacterium sp. RU37D]